MGNFFKTFARGILYVLVLPLLVLALAISVVVSLFAFIFIGGKAIVLFFKGENIFGDLPEDVEAKRRLEKMKLGNINLDSKEESISIQKEAVIPPASIKEEPAFVPLIEPKENETIIFEHLDAPIISEDEIEEEPEQVIEPAITIEEPESEIVLQEPEEVIEEIPVETKRPSFLRETRFKEESTDDDVGVEITYDEERRNR